MVEEASGAVALVGGFSDVPDYDTIFRLADTRSDWEELPQRLAHQREFHVAFLVPDTYTKCVPAS